MSKKKSYFQNFDFKLHPWKQFLTVVPDEMLEDKFKALFISSEIEN